MAIERNSDEERQARIEMMIGQFRAAQQRRLVRRGVVLWKRAEAAQRAMAFRPKPAPDKIH